MNSSIERNAIIKVNRELIVADSQELIFGHKVFVAYELKGGRKYEEEYIIWITQDADGSYLYSVVSNSPEDIHEIHAWWPAKSFEDGFQEGINHLVDVYESIVGYDIKVID